MKQRLFRLFSRTARDRARELDEEIEAHLAMRTEELQAGGMGPEAARAEAVARFGDMKAARRDLESAARKRDFRLGWRERLDDVRRDLTVAFRQARSRPGNSAITIAIFGLGIGITTVMFAITDNILLRPLPFPEPDRLVSLQSVSEDLLSFQSVSMGNWYDWQTESRSLEASALYRELELTVAFDSEVHRVPAASVSGAFF